MLVDIFTYNERISEYIGDLLRKEVESDTSESNNLPLYSILGVNINKMDLKEVDKLVGDSELGNIRSFGGYEIRDSKTGRILVTKKSLTEIIASQSMDN